MKTKTAQETDVRQLLADAHAIHDKDYIYGVQLRVRADRLIKKCVSLALAEAPLATFRLHQHSPTEYRLYVDVDTKAEERRVRKAVDDITLNALFNQDIWLIVFADKRVKYDPE